MTPLRQRVVQEALSWCCTPYHHQAMIKGTGVDCAMLLKGVYLNTGLIKDEPIENYSIDFHLHRDEERFLRWLDHFGVRTTEPKVGDVVCFKFGRVFSHGGILVSDLDIVHALRKLGKVTMSPIDGESCGNRPRVFYTFPGFEA